MTTRVLGPDAASLAPMPQHLNHEHRGHAVQFYKEDGILLDALSRFIGTALGAGDAAIVIATQEHREGLVQRLKARGLDTAKAVKQGRYIPLDAAETLSKLIVDGLPDKVLFADLIGGLVARAKAAAEGEQPPIAIFGEMVALLWADCKVEAAIRLEQLWNDLARTYSFSLCCVPDEPVYRRPARRAVSEDLCRTFAVIPSESYTSLAGEEQRLRNIAQLQQKAQAFEAEMELRQSEERFRLLTDAVQDYAIFMLDPEGRISSWNSGAQRIKGYETSEIIGKHFSCFYPEEDVRFGKPQRELEIAGREGRVEDDVGAYARTGPDFGQT